MCIGGGGGGGLLERFSITYCVAIKEHKDVIHMYLSFALGSHMYSLLPW